MKINHSSSAAIISCFAALSLSVFSCSLFSSENYPDLTDALPPEDTLTFNDSEYQVTFFDDFMGTDLDDTKWERCPEWERQNSDGNGCWWNDDCSYVENGQLVLKAMRQDGTNYSGAVRSRDRFEQQGGLYTFKFKADKASGLWYALWLMTDEEANTGNGAVDGGEIDIAELISNDPWAAAGEKQYINSAVHWDGYGENHQSNGSQYYTDSSFYDRWHIITFEWTENSYKAYLDNSTTPYWIVTGEAAVKEWGGIVTTQNYIKITCEFGTWGGNVDEAKLPAYFYVDWVKAYKK